MTSILAKLKPEQWKELQATAKRVLETPGKIKVLPSSYKALSETEFPISFNRRLLEEESKHNDHSQEFHKGGGLGTAVNSVLSATWDSLGSVPGSHWLYDTLFDPDKGGELQQMDQYNADVLQQAYNRDIDTRAATIHGWLRIPRYDTDYMAVYYDPGKQDVHVAIRGSKSAYDWYHHNAGIVTSQHPGVEETNVLREDLLQISKDFPNHELFVASHSLSGAFLADIFNDASAEDKVVLDNYDHLLMYNPGSSPLADTESIEKILKDDRLRLFLNKSDLINQTYNQLVGPENEYVYGDSTFNPLTAHSYSQWMSDDQELDKEVDWGEDPYVPDIGGWDVGTDTQAAFDELKTFED